MSWNNRVLKIVVDECTVFCVCENHGRKYGHTKQIAPMGVTLHELREEIVRMLKTVDRCINGTEGYLVYEGDEDE
jgi:hypothetical protein